MHRLRRETCIWFQWGENITQCTYIVQAQALLNGAKNERRNGWRYNNIMNCIPNAAPLPIQLNFRCFSRFCIKNQCKVSETCLLFAFGLFFVSSRSHIFKIFGISIHTNRCAHWKTTKMDSSVWDEVFFVVSVELLLFSTVNTCLK